MLDLSVTSCRHVERVSDMSATSAWLAEHCFRRVDSTCAMRRHNVVDMATKRVRHIEHRMLSIPQQLVTTMWFTNLPGVSNLRVWYVEHFVLTCRQSFVCVSTYFRRHVDYVVRHVEHCLSARRTLVSRWPARLTAKR